MACDSACPFLVCEHGMNSCRATNASRDCHLEQHREKLLEKGLDPDE